MSTEKLYRQDAYITEFTANVLQAVPISEERWEVILDRTAFYPLSGGQLHDTGTLGGEVVLEVREAGDTVVHVTKAPLPVGQTEGKVDWLRRFDHMQQHTGEHILCGAFFALLGANNIGFHMGEQSSQIDLDLPGLTPEQVEAVEDLANQAIYNNYPITCHHTTGEKLDRFHLRKQPAKSFAALRLIEVQGFDCCPCGGTHVGTAGEVGLIKVRYWENKKHGVRVDFVCGRRAMADYRQKNAVIHEIASHLSVPVGDVLPAFIRQSNKAVAAQKELAATRKELLQQQAVKWLQDTAPVGGKKIITRILAGSGPQELKEVANSLMDSGETVVALLVGKEESSDRVHLLFTSTPGIAADMNILLKSILPLISGRGGGTAQLAQGGGTASGNLQELLVTAQQSLLRQFDME